MDDYRISSLKDKQSPISNASPILILGIIIFVLPFFNAVFNWNLPGWLSAIGIFLIIAGALHSGIKMMN